jgi:hypothetical protein
MGAPQYAHLKHAQIVAGGPQDLPGRRHNRKVVLPWESANRAITSSTHRAERTALEPDFSAADRASDSAQNPEDDADQHEDAADRVQDRDSGEVADQQKNDAENDHDKSDP